MSLVLDAIGLSTMALPLTEDAHLREGEAGIFLLSRFVVPAPSEEKPESPAQGCSQHRTARKWQNPSGWVTQEGRLPQGGTRRNRRLPTRPIPNPISRVGCAIGRSASRSIQRAPPGASGPPRQSIRSSANRYLGSCLGQAGSGNGETDERDRHNDAKSEQDQGEARLCLPAEVLWSLAVRGRDPMLVEAVHIQVLPRPGIWNRAVPIQTHSRTVAHDRVLFLHSLQMGSHRHADPQVERGHGAP